MEIQNEIKYGKKKNDLISFSFKYPKIPFSILNAIKYIKRLGLKYDSTAKEDLQKAKDYLTRFYDNLHVKRNRITNWGEISENDLILIENGFKYDLDFQSKIFRKIINLANISKRKQLNELIDIIELLELYSYKTNK